MIKLTMFFILSCITVSAVVGQYTLDTPDGKRVKLNTNGTWQFVKQGDLPKGNKGIPKANTATYVSKNKKYAIWYDPNEWQYDTSATDDALSWDVTFYSKDRAITGYSMVSRLSIPVEDLETTIRQQWQKTGTITSFTTFSDTLNGLPVAGFDMLLEFSGLVYQYRGYIHSTGKGSFQFMVGTQKEIFEEDKRKIEELCKGITGL